MTEESVTKVAVCGNEQFTDAVDDVPLDGPVLSVIINVSTETIAHSRPVVAGVIPHFNDTPVKFSWQ